MAKNKEFGGKSNVTLLVNSKIEILYPECFLNDHAICYDLPSLDLGVKGVTENIIFKSTGVFEIKWCGNNGILGNGIHYYNLLIL